MEFELAAADLLTVVGASAAAGLIAQFAKKLLNLGAAATRTVAMMSGLAVVVTATLQALSSFDLLTMILAVLVGMQAGLAASATFDVAREGMDYIAEPRPAPVEEDHAFDV